MRKPLTGTHSAELLRQLRDRVVNTPTWENEAQERTASEFRTDVLAHLDAILFAEESP